MACLLCGGSHLSQLPPPDDSRGSSFPGRVPVGIDLPPKSRTLPPSLPQSELGLRRQAILLRGSGQTCSLLNRLKPFLKWPKPFFLHTEASLLSLPSSAILLPGNSHQSYVGEAHGPLTYTPATSPGVGNPVGGVTCHSWQR